VSKIHSWWFVNFPMMFSSAGLESKVLNCSKDNEFTENLKVTNSDCACNGFMTLISIEGNIAVGKTTVLDIIDNIMKERRTSTSSEGKEIVQTIREPIDEWTLPRAVDGGKSRLQLVYEDPKTHTASFQKGVLDDLPNAIKKVGLTFQSLEEVKDSKDYKSHP
jgi:ABC-type transport system involved in cytochrome c biogenesis ATPase subunit